MSSMEGTEQPPLPLQLLVRGRRKALADVWQRAIARTGYVGPARAVQQHVLGLTDQALAALLAEPFDEQQGRNVGAALVRLGYTAPEALSATLAVQSDWLPADLSTEGAANLRPRLGALLGSIAAGFVDEARKALQAEQESILAALLTDKQRAAVALQRQAALLDLAQDAILVRDAATDAVVFWNHGAEAMFGWPRDAVVGKPARAVLQTHFPQPRAAIEAALERDGRWEGELSHVRKDGSAITVSSRWALQREPGRPAAVLEISTDITAQKAMEAMLRDREASSETAQRIAHLGSFDWDFVTNVVHWSDELFRLFGLTPGEVVPSLETFMQAVHPDDHPVLGQFMQGAFAGMADPFEFRTAGRDGTVRLLHTQTEVLCDPQTGQGTFIFGTSMDITERRRAELALREEVAERRRAEEALAANEERLRTLVTNAPVVLFALDMEGRFTLCEGRGMAALGLRPGQAVGQSVFEVYRTAPRILADVRRALTGEALSGVREIAEGWFEIHYQPVPNAAGAVAGVIGVATDVTERKRFEAELEQARDVALEASRAKSAFLATMSHEIRTPMNAVIGMSGLLLDTELTLDQQEFAEIIRGSGDALLTIINDILDFSKIEAGMLNFETQPFVLRECAEAVLDLVAPLAAEKGLDLAYEVEDTVPVIVVGDVTRLRQILLNLLGNAVKFTKQGEVVLSIGAQPLGDGRYDLHFAVRDTGIGIPLDRIDGLFQPFTQLDASMTRRYGGTGLGLVISRRLAELMGGSIRAESAVDKGTTFHLRLVAETTAAVTPHADFTREHPHLRGRRLLVVDHNATSRLIMVRQARAWGMVASETASPYEALAWIERGEPFDVAILDMNMPEMTGVSLATSIRRHRDAESLALVLFSSLGQRERLSDSLGPVAYLTKPLKPSQLLDTLLDVCAERPSEVRPVERIRPRSDPAMAERLPLRILLAEDNAVNQKVAVRQLAQLGYRADVVGNGQEAVTSVARQGYDVVLMDVQMPELDGLSATRQICARWGPEERPWIVAMTANAMQGDRETCLAAGMDDYISKPIRMEELIAALANRPSPLARETRLAEREYERVKRARPASLS